MRWGVLGPLLVHNTAGEPVTPAGPARRLLLAALVSRANTSVSAETLANDLWGEVPPRTAAKTLQSHLVRLRDDLGRDDVADVIVTDPTGYRLNASREDVDALQFVALVDAARTADPEAAHRDLTQALALWRGAAYEEFPDAPFLVAERLRLSELLALAEEQCTDHALQLGQAAELVPELERRVAATPYRERTWEQLVLALYRCGRQADALGAYRRARDVLASELGVDPGPGLRELESAVLRQDPALLATAVRSRVEISDSGRCPYRGLTGYGGDDAALFVGRERLTARVAGLCAEHPVVVVTGASGAGKSSLVRAGLVPALRAGALPGSASWHTSVVTPTELGGSVPAVDLLVLDQAEDLLVRVDLAQREEIVAQLVRHVDEGRRLVVVIRGDFYGRLIELSPLDRYGGRATVLVGPMRDDELARVVTEPAARAGLEVGAGLVDAVLDDMTGRTAALPLLSVALVRTWENREGPELTVDGYARGGGVAGAVEAAAEECFTRLDTEAASAARRLLLRLCVRDSGAWVTRPLERTAVDDDEATGRAVAALLDARLVSVDATHLRLAHDALVEQWPRLRGWLAERELAADLLAHLESAARAWDTAGRTGGDLYRGARLQAAQSWTADHPGDVSALESEFLQASERASQSELVDARARADREAAGRRRLRRVAVALVAVVAVAVAGGSVAVVERERARDAAVSADARRLAAEALTAPDLRTSLLLAAAAYRLQDSPDTRSALLTELERGGSALFHVPTHERVIWVGADAAGSQVWWLDNTREVTRYDVRTRSVADHFHVPGSNVSSISPDGRFLVASGPRGFNEQAGNTRAVVLETTTGTVAAVLPTRAAAMSPLPCLFTADGSWLVVPVATSADGSVGKDVDVYRTGVFTRPARRLHLPAPLVGLAAGRHAVAAVDARGTVTVVGTGDGRVRATAAVPASVVNGQDSPVVALDGDDRHVALAAPGAGTATILDTLRHTTVSTADAGAAVAVAAFGPDDRSLALGYDSGAVSVFGLDGRASIRTAGGAGPVRGIAWSGTTSDTGLYSGGLDSQVVAWDLRQGGRLVRLDRPELPPVDLGVSSSRVFVSLAPPQGNGPPSAERLVAVDLVTHARRSWPAGLSDDQSVSAISVTPDGSRALVAVILPDRRFRYDLWDLAAGRKVTSFVPTQRSSPHQAFGGVLSRDGRSAIVNVDDDRLGVVALPSGRVERSFGVRFSGASGSRTLAIPVAMSPSGLLLLNGYDPGRLQADANGNALATRKSSAVQQVALADVSKGRLVGTARLTPLGLGNNAAWSGDGTRLVFGALDGNIWLLDAKTMHVIAGPVTAVPDVVSATAFSPDGRTIAVAGGNGTLTFWDGSSLRPLGTPVKVGDGLWPLASFNRDGSALVGLAPTADGQQQWFRVPTRPAEWVRTACAIAGPPLSRAEWAQYVGDRPYRATC